MLVTSVVHKLQQVARLAAELMAQGHERGKADGLGLVVFENGQVCGGDADALGQLPGGDFALGHHDVQIHENFHAAPPRS